MAHKLCESEFWSRGILEQQFRSEMQPIQIHKHQI